MTDHEFKRQCLELMETSEAAYLATVDAPGSPQIRAVTNLRRRQEFPALAPLFAEHQDDFLVYVATSAASNKRRQIRANPAVSVYYCRPSEFHGVLLEGQAEVMDDPDLKRAVWQPAWGTYWTGPADPDYIVLRLLPQRASGWWWDKTFSFRLPCP